MANNRRRPHNHDVFPQVWGMDLAPILTGHFQLTHHYVGETNLQIGLVSTQTGGCCPGCQMPAHKVYSFYQRTLTDLPICGKAVSLRIHQRKFFCRHDNCARKIFAQTILAYFRPYARRLNRAEQPWQAMALQTGARPAVRLSALIGQPDPSPDTVVPFRTVSQAALRLKRLK